MSHTKNTKRFLNLGGQNSSFDKRSVRIRDPS